jgi:sulfite exporter TauE/SafE
MILDLIGPLFIGFVGSLHCLGMCGPLVMAYSLHIRPAGGRPMEISSLWSKGLSHHIAFHLGRLFTYGLLGALSAGLAHLVEFNQFFSDLRGGVTLGGGILMVLFGLVLLKVIPLRVPSVGKGSFFSRLFPALFQSQSLPSKLALGVATGFLPCMLSWAMIIKAATTQNPIMGFFTMAFFGLGTIPVLFFTGLSASLLTLKIRFFGERAAALSVMAMGFILLLKGARYFA